jgi:hypothetical protein
VAKKQSARNVPEPLTSDTPAPLRALQELDARVTQLLEPVVGDLEAALAQLAGKSFGLETNKALVLALRQLLQRVGLRVRCPRCGEPAYLRCRQPKHAREGAFQFEHFQEGKQTNHGGGTIFPQLSLVAAPPDRRTEPKDRKGR